MSLTTLVINDSLWVMLDEVVGAGRDGRRMEVFTKAGGGFKWEFATEQDAIAAMKILKDAKETK